MFQEDITSSILRTPLLQSTSFDNRRLLKATCGRPNGEIWCSSFKDGQERQEEMFEIATLFEKFFIPYQMLKRTKWSREQNAPSFETLYKEL